MSWRGPLQLCASILAGAGFMTWEITHNIESLLVKDERKTCAGFDFTVDVNADGSHDLAECVKVPWLDVAWDYTSTDEWQKKLWSSVPNSLVTQFSKVMSSPLAIHLSIPQRFLDFLQEFDDDDARILGTQMLASLEIPDEAETKKLNELVASCDNRILIGLARLPGLDTRLLGVHRIEPEATVPLPGSIESDLQALLLKLPLTGLDPCTTWFTRNAILTGKSASQHRRPLFWSFSGDSLSFAHTLSSMPAEQVELYYLKALTRHSMVPSHRSLMVENGVLDLIFREIKHRFHSLRIKREIGLLLGNLALEESAHEGMVEQGCLPLLRSWLYSDDLALVSHAVRTLANLDRDFCKDESYEDGVYLLHPQGRYTSSIDADVVFVHGLRGGPFMTWRQQEEKEIKKSGTDCWPKSWLVRDIPNIRVLMVEYDTSLSHWVSQCPQEPETRSLMYRSEEIRRKLRKAGVGKRPVIWVVHSMGGLLVKQLLLDAEKSDEFRCMYDNTKGIVFYSTPHLGSALASYSSQARHLLLPSVEVKELCQKSPFLATLHENFLALVQRHPVKLLSFGETVPMKLSWMLQTVLVTNDSAARGTCDFESGLCGYVHDQNSDFEWTNNTGPTYSSYTGPKGDHTSGTGTYMYIETSSPRLNREAAHLISPRISRADGNCLSFYFHMHGLNIRELAVYVQTLSGSRQLLWRLNGEQGDDWKFALVPLSIPKRQAVKVVFGGVAGAGYMGDIAIDDIMVFKKKGCALKPPNATPRPPRPTPVPTPPVVGSCGSKTHTRIVGGTTATPKSWPWQAMLMYQRDNGEWRQFCGGSLVHHEWILTAAHCVVDIRKGDYATHMVRMGAHYKNTSLLIGSEQDFHIKRIYFHHEYNSVTRYNYDIALIRLDRPAILHDGVAFVCLPDDQIAFPPGSDCWITGWGTLKPGGESPDELQQAMVPLVSNQECTKNGSYEASKITPEMLCAGFPQGGKDACQGDSGGPLVCEDNGKWYLMGDTSWGYSCAEPNYYGVYARVAVLKDWVFHVMAYPDI